MGSVSQTLDHSQLEEEIFRINFLWAASRKIRLQTYLYLLMSVGDEFQNGCSRQLESQQTAIRNQVCIICFIFFIIIHDQHFNSFCLSHNHIVPAYSLVQSVPIVKLVSFFSDVMQFFQHGCQINLHLFTINRFVLSTGLDCTTRPRNTNSPISPI